MSRLLAVDWGSSSMRAALLDDAGNVLEERTAETGMLKVDASGFDAVFEAKLGDWMDAPGTRCLMAGMVGSRQGWVEADYIPCPCGIDDFAGRLRAVGREASKKARDIAIVPGASCTADGVPDVLRGEEVKVFGALDLLDAASLIVVSPGTHSKWMTVADGRLTHFSTAMTGEVYALLRHRSILARSLPASDDAPLDEQAFDDGVRRALRSRSLLHTAFGVRTRSLFEDVRGESLASYLSGLVIGDEMRCRPLDGIDKVALVGAPALTTRYARALSLCGVDADVLDERAVWRGLHAIDRARRARTGARS